MSENNEVVLKGILQQLEIANKLKVIELEIRLDDYRSSQIAGEYKRRIKDIINSNHL